MCREGLSIGAGGGALPGLSHVPLRGMAIGILAGVASVAVAESVPVEADRFRARRPALASCNMQL